MTAERRANPWWRNVGHVARDVVEEALRRKTVLTLLALTAMGQVGLALALDIDVAEGMIAGTRLFGQELGRGGDGADMLATWHRALGHFVFHVGILAGIVATSDLAVRALAPGRVELLLSLPLRRVDLVLGLYLGVACVALGWSAFAVGGFSLVLSYKVDVPSLTPLAAALAASIGFAAIYAFMLLVTTVQRSASLAAAAGMGLYVFAAAASKRQEFLRLFEAGPLRDVTEIVVAPLPRLLGVAKLGADLAAGVATDAEQAALALGTTVLFACAALALATWRIHRRDW